MNSFTLLLTLACTMAAAWADTDIPFWTCNGGVAAPSAVKMNCTSIDRGICVLNKGDTYLLQVDFTPTSAVSDVESSVAWKTWVEMPLPGQETDACDGHLSCPLTPGRPTTFTYPFHIQSFWMRRRYPLVWRLRDDDTDAAFLCFYIRVRIAS